MHMLSAKELLSLKKKVEMKEVSTDYDLGVLNTIKWFLGDPNPYKNREEEK